MALVAVTDDAGGIVIIKATARRKRIVIQNVGTVPVLLKIDDDPAVNDFDMVLAGGAADRDGIGGSIILEGNHGEIKAITEDSAGTNLTVLEVYN